MLRLCVSGGEPTRKMGSAGVHWGASRDLNGTTQQHTVTRSVPRNRHAQISERQDSQLNNIAISVSRYARCQPTNMTEKKDKDGDRDLPDTCRPQSGGGESAGNRQPAPGSSELALAISLFCSLSLSIALALSCYLLLFSLALFLSRSPSLYLALALFLSRQLSLSLAISCSILSSCFSLACSLCPLPLARTCALRPSCYVSVPATAVDRNSDSSSGPQP